MNAFRNWNFKEWVIDAIRAGKKGVLADLQDANLRSANLRCADLQAADLRSADLRGAKLRSANLQDANLRSVNLWDANLRSADLGRTILDPSNKPNADAEAFARIDGWVIGWRTGDSPIIGGPGYQPGGIKYTTPVFSTCPVTVCHPGLYLRPEREECDIMVLARAEDVHRVGNKWRCREFVTA